MPVLPEITWERNRIWIWDCSHFTARQARRLRDRRRRHQILDRLPAHQRADLDQAQLLFARALEDQELLDADGLPPDRDPEDPPILVAWSDNGSEMTAVDTRQFMALMAIAQHHGRPGTPTDQAHIESFFSHLKGDWPHLTDITRPAALDTSSPGSAASTTPSGSTPRSATSPPMTSITAAGPASAALAPRDAPRPRRADQAESSQQEMSDLHSIDRVHAPLGKRGAFEGVARRPWMAGGMRHGRGLAATTTNHRAPPQPSALG